MSEETNSSQENPGSCLALTVAIIFILLLFIAGATAFQVYEDQVWLVPGDPDNFDPVAQFSDVAGYAGEDTRLLQIEAYFVRRDGTLDLNASYDPSPYVYYTFYRQTNGSDAPTGVGGSADHIFYRYIWVTISQPFQWAFATQGAAGDGIGFDLNLGMDKDRSIEEFGNPGEGIAAPECSFRDLWTIAIESAGADSEAVATIVYNADGYTFTIQSTDVNLLFDTRCELAN